MRTCPLILAMLMLFTLPACNETDNDAGTGALPPPPTANIEGELTHDFGAINFSGRQTLRHTFTVRNADDRTHRMMIDGTTCECITGELPTDSLAPGESMNVDVALLIGKPGHVEQKVYLNASGALVILLVKANVVEAPQDEPQP